MSRDRNERTIDELESHACKWWPREVHIEAQTVSVLQILLDTQEKFINILKLASKDDLSVLFSLIEVSKFAYNLFVKHLIVLVDFGSEPLQRVNKDFFEFFPSGKMTYNVGNGDEEYLFTALPARGVLNNKKMKIDTVEHLTSNEYDTQLCKDLIALLVYGNACTNPQSRSVFFKCSMYELLGDASKVEKFVRQNYIRVSRIISGKTTTEL